MRVVQDGKDEAAGLAARPRLVTSRSFHAGPAVVLAAGAAGGLEVHLLAAVLAHVRDEEVARQPVEADAPGVAETQGPDFGPCTGGTDERVARRDLVVRRHVRDVDVEPQDLAQECPEALAAAERVAAPPAVAHRGVQVAVGPEHQPAAVVVAVGRVRDGQEDALGALIADVGAGGRRVVAREHDVAVTGPRVVHEEVAVGGVVRVEGEAEEPTLATADDQAADVQERVQERGGARLRELVREDPAVGLDDEEPLVPRVGDADRPRQARDDLLEGHAPRALERGGVAGPLGPGGGAAVPADSVAAAAGCVGDGVTGSLIEVVEGGGAPSRRRG